MLLDREYGQIVADLSSEIQNNAMHEKRVHEENERSVRQWYPRNSLDV